MNNCFIKSLLKIIVQFLDFYFGGSMELKKRKEYLILTNIFWWLGFLIFGGIAASSKQLLHIPYNTFMVFLLYGIEGGLLLGGLASGIIFFFDFIKRQKLYIKIILSVFFPITFVFVCYFGILSLIPYEIYNFIVMKKIK